MSYSYLESLDNLNCPKCGSVCALTLREYLTEKDRLKMECIKCRAIIYLKPLDHPDRAKKPRKSLSFLKMCLDCVIGGWM